MDSFYSFSSINGLNSTTASELIYKPSAIERAFTMCQVNNRLVLGNVEAAQIKWGKLQKYASAIFTEVAVKKVENLHDIENKDASFHPVHNIFDVGFQWGEIYSLGIVYVLDNGITSPVYHIPGVKNNVLNSDIIPDNNRNVINKFRKAIDRGLEFVKKNNSETIANVIKSEFTGTSFDDIVKVVDRYKGADSWQTDTTIREGAYNNLLDF